MIPSPCGGTVIAGDPTPGVVAVFLTSVPPLRHPRHAVLDGRRMLSDACLRFGVVRAAMAADARADPAAARAARALDSRARRP